jgi:hypothetical protein
MQMVTSCVTTTTILSAPLCLAGKLPERLRLYQLNAVGVLIYLADTISNKKTFLVDTGAAVSVFPHSGPAHKADSYLTGLDNKPIHSWGNKMINVCFGGHIFACEFVLAAVNLRVYVQQQDQIIAGRLPCRY